MGKVYVNPPIIEAICEFRFKPSQEWDWTIPGLIYDKVKKDFPKKRQQGSIQFQFQVTGQENAEAVQGNIARMQFLREDEKALVQVGPDILVVNHLRPYPTWSVFKGMIIDALDIYKQVAQPEGLTRIGLRYINRIDVPRSEAQIEDYLLAIPQVPEPIPQLFATWVQRVEIPFEDTNGLLALQSGSIQQPQQKELAFLLDLDFSTLRAESVALDSALIWIEQAHDRIEQAFEASITDNTRELFKEVSLVK